LTGDKGKYAQAETIGVRFQFEDSKEKMVENVVLKKQAEEIVDRLSNVNGLLLKSLILNHLKT